MSTIRRQAGPRPRRWSKQEYHRLGELGFFRGQRVELLGGRIVVLSPQSPEHAFAVDRVTQLLHAHFGQGYWVRMQLPLDLGRTTEPEPDVSVVLGDPAQFRSAHPTGAVLIVEVSDSSLSYDRRRKGSLYARAGIADYWIVNLRHRHLEVYRDPVPDAAQRYGHRYSSRTDLTPPATATPLALPQAAVAVADLLA
jgi:Uma2 family endonuclease